MLLDTVTRSLQIGLLEGITTNDLAFTCDFTEVRYPNQEFKEAALGLLTGTPYINMVGAPLANVRRIIDEINVYNADTVTHNVFIALVDNSAYYVVFKATLTTGQTLHYSNYFGWTIN